MDAVRATLRSLRDPDRLRALEQSGLLDRHAAATFSRLLQLAVRLLNGTVAWIAAVDNIRDVIICSIPSTEVIRSPHEAQFTSWLARESVMKAMPLIIPDVRRHERWRDQPLRSPAPLLAAASMPLAVDDKVIGAFIVADSSPREWTADEIGLLQDLAAFTTSDLDRRVAHQEAMRSRAAARDAERRIITLAESVQAAEERFRLATQATQDLFYDYDVRSRHLWCTENVRDVLGYDEQDISTDPAWWRERLHPDDRERVTTLLRDTIARRGSFFRTEFRFRAADGRYVELFDRGYVTYDDEGRPLRKIGALTSVNPLAHATRTLRDDDQQQPSPAPTPTLTLIDHLHIVVFQTDRDGRLTCVNRAWTDLTGWTREESFGRYFVDVLPPDQRRVCADELTALVREGGEWHREDLRIQSRSGDVRTFDVRVRGLTGPSGELIGACGTLIDLIDLRAHVSLRAR
jgi:PAS domain S-box-containing protein